MSESIRDRIARALVPHVEVCPAFWCSGALGGCFECWALAVEAADALLAEFPVLAGVTDEAVEAGARALHDRFNDELGDPCQFDELPPTAQELLRGDARTVLEAAVLGSRDADAPGDGSTEHVRDRLSNCKRCGEGLTARAIVDGETPCPGDGSTM